MYKKYMDILDPHFKVIPDANVYIAIQIKKISRNIWRLRINAPDMA